MTPERIAELRAHASRDCLGGAACGCAWDCSDVRELLDEVERGRGEIADLLARLDAAAFGASWVHARLEAAEKLAQECETALGRYSGRSWVYSRDEIKAALSAYREATK